MKLGVVALVDRGAVYARVSISERELVCLIVIVEAVSIICKVECKRLRPSMLAVHTIGGHMLQASRVSKSIAKAESRFLFMVTANLQRPILGPDFLREVRAMINLRIKKVVIKYSSFPSSEAAEIL